MVEKYLTWEQSVCAARIFLNTFGLTLDIANDINEFAKLKIFDNAGMEVGELYLNNYKVIMSANYNNSILEANFDIPKMVGFADIECNNALVGQWSSKINFHVQMQNNVKLSGEFLIENVVDSEFGVSCLCRPLINFEIFDKANIILRILRNGRTFSLEIDFDSYKEIIDIMPYDDMNGFIKHIIKSGEYDRKTHMYPYRKYAGIFSAEKIDKGKLHVFLEEKECDDIISLRSEFLPKVGVDESKELLIQKGILMKQLDPDMFNKIEELRKVLFIGDVSLLDNLINVCYDEYTDEEIHALLGVERQQMNYQDGSENLVNSYYGIGKSSCFFSLDIQKRLLKK